VALKNEAKAVAMGPIGKDIPNRAVRIVKGFEEVQEATFEPQGTP
jgi:hypothetical protein